MAAITAEVIMSSTPSVARGPDMEADVDLELSCALLCLIMESTWGGSGPAPEPPDFEALHRAAYTYHDVPRSAIAPFLLTLFCAG